MRNNKVLRFLFFESSSKRRIFLTIALIVMAMLEYRWVQAQRSQIDQAARAQALVDKIPYMKQQLTAREQTLIIVPQEVNTPQQIIKLEGILFGGDAAAALIDGKVYRPGDNILHYTVSEITSRAVVLRDKKTRKTIRLYLPEINPKFSSGLSATEKEDTIR